MAKKVKVMDKRKIRGIRRRWLINSVGVVLLVLVLALGVLLRRHLELLLLLYHQRSEAPGRVHCGGVRLLYPQPVLDQCPECGAAV